MRALLGILVVASSTACGASAPPTTTATTPVTAQHDQARTPPTTAPADTQAELVPALDPRIQAAVAQIDESRFRATLTAIAVPRHARTARPGLERVATYVATELTHAGFRVSRQPVDYDGLRADNVIGERAGTDPSRVIVIAAHYDAVPGTAGADDDGSGVAAIVEAARVLGPLPTAATIRVIAFAFEEDGLVGSQRYVAALPPAEAQRIAIVLSLDMIGFHATAPGSQQYPPGADALLVLATGRRAPTQGDFIAWLGLDDLAPDDLARLRDAGRYVPSLTALGLTVPRAAVTQLPDLLRGDHASFWQGGIRAVGITDTGNFRNPNYHLPSDTLDTINFPFATAVTRWLTAITLSIASEP